MGQVWDVEGVVVGLRSVHRPAIYRKTRTHRPPSAPSPTWRDMVLPDAGVGPARTRERAMATTRESVDVQVVAKVEWSGTDEEARALAQALDLTRNTPGAPRSPGLLALCSSFRRAAELASVAKVEAE